jgi:hypothetical protein
MNADRMHQRDSNSIRLTTEEVSAAFAATLSDLLRVSFMGIMSKAQMIHIIYIPEPFLDQASQDPSRLDEYRQGMHWGVPSHNRACKGYCAFMLANEKIFG